MLEIPFPVRGLKLVLILQLIKQTGLSLEIPFPVRGLKLVEILQLLPLFQNLLVRNPIPRKGTETDDHGAIVGDFALEIPFPVRGLKQVYISFSFIE